MSRIDRYDYRIITIRFSWKSINTDIELRPTSAHRLLITASEEQHAAVDRRYFLCLSLIRWLRFCLTSQLSNAFHELFRRPACFLWHLQMNAIGQFVFYKDYVVRRTTDALMRPHLLPSNRPLQLSCSSVCQPPWCLFMVFIGSLYCAQWGLNLYN